MTWPASMLRVFHWPVPRQPFLRACGALVLLLAALGLADCGKRGSPHPPPGVPDIYPRAYPRE